MRHVFKTNNDYASTSTELAFILRKGFNRLYKKGRVKEYPELAIDILSVLICKLQKINQLNDECNPVKWYECSSRELAAKVGEHQTFQIHHVISDGGISNAFQLAFQVSIRITFYGIAITFYQLCEKAH